MACPKNAALHGPKCRVMLHIIPVLPAMYSPRALYHRWRSMGLERDCPSIFYTGFTYRGFVFYAALLYFRHEVKHMKIYIVEDDPEIRELEQYALESSGFQAESFPSAGPFYTALSSSVPDLILLDIMLPGEDGLTILRRLRTRSDTCDTPVILVTAKDSELDTVRGLDLGADDYLPKPFGIMELISRVKARLRGSAAATPVQYHYGGLYLSEEKHLVTVDGEPVELTYKEFELLKLLLSAPGNAFTRDVIMERIWGYHYELSSRTLDMHVKTLRQKLGKKGPMIQTIRNVGFKLERLEE